MHAHSHTHILSLYLSHTHTHTHLSTHTHTHNVYSQTQHSLVYSNTMTSIPTHTNTHTHTHTKHAHTDTHKLSGLNEGRISRSISHLLSSDLHWRRQLPWWQHFPSSSSDTAFCSTWCFSWYPWHSLSVCHGWLHWCPAHTHTHTIFFFILFWHVLSTPPQWGTVVAEINSPLFDNPELSIVHQNLYLVLWLQKLIPLCLITQSCQMYTKIYI